MHISSSQCTDNIELTLFTLTIILFLFFIISSLGVFLNESDDDSEDEKPSWEFLPLLWLWPLRPFWTDSGLNHWGKKYRPLYILSTTLLLALMSFMYFSGYCAGNT